MKKVLIYTSIMALFTLSLLVSMSFAAKPVLTFDHLYTNDQVVEALRTLNKAYPNLTTMESLGKSEENRDIWLFTINNLKTGKDTDKPGIYVDGTIHGNEIQATEVCLYLTYYLLNSYGNVDKITDLVDSRAFYIIPIVNVDNRAHFFSDPSDCNDHRSARVPYDDDRDGLVDEDDVDDLDGDNEILEMRIRDPYGKYKTDPEDPRLMVRIKPGEKGEWTRLGEEGIDNDGDGRINEDGPGYLDMNRNYGFKWQPPYIQSGAGDYPMSAKIPHAISQFVVTKPNICFDFAFHNSGRLWVRGPGSKLAGMYSPQDIRVYDYIGGEAEKITPGYRYIIGSKDMYTTHGDFDEFMYSVLGIYGFVGELYSSEKETYRRNENKKDEGGPRNYWSSAPQEERIKFNDRLMQGQMYKDWKKFNHPQFGEIEIGGWRKFTSRIPQNFMLNEMVHRAASVVIFVAEQTPEITLELIDVKDLGNGLKRIRVRAGNESALPSLSSKIMRDDIIRKDIFKIEGVDVVSGGIIQDIHRDRVDFVEHRPWMIFTNVPAFGKRDIQWIVRGSGTATVTFDGLKAANRTIDVKL